MLEEQGLLGDLSRTKELEGIFCTRLQPRYLDTCGNQPEHFPHILLTQCPLCCILQIHPIEPAPLSRSPSRVVPNASHSASSTSRKLCHLRITAIPTDRFGAAIWSVCRTLPPTKSSQGTMQGKDPTVWFNLSPRGVEGMHLV